ncbi:MAG: M20 metallopeptidase family protein [Limnochordia bacterium]
MRSYLLTIREELHQQPELAFQEEKTSAVIARELRRFGFKVRTGVGKTGVVGLLRFDEDGPCAALRADMDALPVLEETAVPYASRHPGVMHACGHDSHMAIALGCCRYFAENKTRFRGTFMAVFQPAEEIVGGAPAMLADGVFQDARPDVLFALHNWPQIPTGTVGIQAGPLTAFADRFQVVFRGVGGHGALPHKARDPIAMAAAAVQGAFAAVQRRSDPMRPRALSFGSIRGGSRFNIIPEEVVLEGTVRTLSPEDQNEMIALLEQVFGAAASAYGGTHKLDYEQGVPAVINDLEVCQRASAVVRERLPRTTVTTSGLNSLIGEDVAYFLQQVPGALLLFGSAEPGKVNELHNPRYLVPDEAVIAGFEAIREILCSYLEI